MANKEAHIKFLKEKIESIPNSNHYEKHQALRELTREISLQNEHEHTILLTEKSHEMNKYILSWILKLIIILFVITQIGKFTSSMAFYFKLKSAAGLFSHDIKDLIIETIKEIKK